MRNRPTEYQAMKKILMRERDNGRMHGLKVNKIIQDSCAEAYRKTDEEERMVLYKQKEILIAHCKNLGESSALELLAAVGDVLNELDGDK